MNNGEVSEGSCESQEWKKYAEYHIKVDPLQDDKATEIKLCSFARPHMRSFHCAWWSFFVAFFTWFSISPLLSEIKEDLGLTKQQIWTSSIVAVGGTIFMRFALGPLCDKFGARVLFTGVLCAASIPTACTGFVNSYVGLVVLRLFIGFVGGTFVMCQFWTSRMFSKEVVGTANAIVAGWGNLGGGVTQLVMGAVLFPLFKLMCDGDSEKAWRTVFVVPAFVSFVTGIVIYRISDDAPTGNYRDLKMHGNMPQISAAESFRGGSLNMNTWFLFVQYACCLGVELTMNNAAALYFKDEFGLSTESAAAIASIYGWTNLFARGLGGFCSDKANAKFAMRGRIVVQTMTLACEGTLVLIFSQMKCLGGAIAIMVMFSICVQAAEGSTFGIVPNVKPQVTGSISGIVGAGGNVGAVCFGLGFLHLEYENAFMIMGFTVLGSSILSLFINVDGRHSSSRRDDQADDEEIVHQANDTTDEQQVKVTDIENR